MSFAIFERMLILELSETKGPTSHVDVFDEAEFVELAEQLRSGEAWPT